MSNFEERFEEEITRIGVTKIANTLGIARNTVYNWIGNGNAPLNMLMSLQGIMGVDLHYVITGDRSVTLNTVGEFIAGTGLAPDEQLLLERYRDSPQVIKSAALQVVLTGQQGEANTGIVIHGSVGQQVDTQTAKNITINMPSETKKRK